MSEEKFEYSYSSLSTEEKNELEILRNKYSAEPEKPKESNKVEELRKLDNKVESSGLIIGLSLGIVGVLTFGLGLTMCLEWNQMAFGIIVSLAGAMLMGIAYPLTNLVRKKAKEKYGPEILRITNELLNEKEGK